MPAPGWLRWTVAVVMAVVALYHLTRLAAASRRRAGVHGPPVRVDVELAHAGMGSTMTVMVLDAVDPAGLLGLGLVFVASTLWFAGRAVHSYAQDGPPGVGVSAPQVIGCAAMAYMLLVLAAPSARSGFAGHLAGAMNGMSMSGAGSSVSNPLSSPLFRVMAAGATIGVAGWTIVRMRDRSVDAAPALSLGCQLAVSMTTVYMLVAM